ncbi:MAG: DUF4935 domain-containing protein [Proteobacteria bacterium]|nr:DUF4935 domain-containing protein [Pseudomonadota bacterium]
MIDLVIDTNIYRKAPRLDSMEFAGLAYLAQKGFLDIHVPYVIEQEFSSHLEIEQRKRLSEVVNRLSRALNFEGKGDATNWLVGVTSQIASKVDEIVLERSHAFRSWLEENGATFHPLTLTQSEKAWEAYFKGALPLKEPKSRKDIPDAFIFQSIVDLKDEHDKSLCVVVEDGDLNEACASRKIPTFKSLADFMKSRQARTYLSFGLIEDNEDKIFNHIKESVVAAADSIYEKIEHLLLSDDYRTLQGDNIPGENHEIYLSLIDKPYGLDIESVEHYYHGTFDVRCTSTVELTYQYPVQLLELVQSGKDLHLVETLNEHYVEVEATNVFIFEVLLGVEAREEILEAKSTEEILGKLNNPDIYVSSLDDFVIVAEE